MMGAKTELKYMGGKTMFTLWTAKLCMYVLILGGKTVSKYIGGKTMFTIWAAKLCMY